MKHLSLMQLAPELLLFLQMVLTQMPRLMGLPSRVEILAEGEVEEESTALIHPQSSQTIQFLRIRLGQMAAASAA